ncbi:proton channel OtopLc-like [Tenebrio molitor]|uniref:proton channel OtopLc-like n=1 Tax=Tenebrio molitor TaxID=7067 RepID=UPI0036248701
MASSRTNGESQDGSVELRNNPRSRVSRQVSGENHDGVELRNHRFQVSRLVSVTEDGNMVGPEVSPGRDKSERFAFGNFQNGGENQQVPPILHRTLSSVLPRCGENQSEHPILHRSVSTVFSKRAPSPTPKAEILRSNIGSKNGNMVLQLVLPSNSNADNGTYLTSNSFEEILGGQNKSRSISGSQQEEYSTVGTECYVNQGFTNDLSEYGRNFAQTPVSLASTPDQVKSTSLEDKKQNFRKHLTSILSSIYALFIVTLGLVVYISDIVLGNSPLAETFSLYLVIIALVFILYVTVDIKLYVNKRNRYNNLMEKNVAEEIEMKEVPGGDYQLNIRLPEAVKIVKQLEHHYCFSKDRHSANFYLKIGAAGFCVGHLIHSGLLLGYQILFLTSDGEAFYECATVISLVLDIFYPIYSFFLLYFIFKYSNIIINRHAAVVRFGVMHCISSSLCFWVWTILRETVEALSNHEYEEETTKEETSTLSEIAFYTGQPVALPLTSYNKRGARVLTAYLNSSLRQFVGECRNDAGLSLIYRNYSPYLYPFTVEYSILVVGVLFVIWQSIGKCKEKEEMSSTRQCDSPIGNNDNLESNVVIHADCHSANKGLFSGIVIMVLTVVSVILFLIAFNDSRYKEEAILINSSTSILIVVLMTITCIFAYRQITKLDVNNEHVSLLDDLLLFICIPAFFLNGIVSIIPAFLSHNGSNIALLVLEVIQVLIQTPLIIDGLRRSSNSKELRREKPGRELLTFLIVCNVAMWIMQTFEVKSHGLQDNRYEFYGEELWTILGHLCVPLMMFYRFHSSVCIVDIWKYAYESAKH